MNGGGGGPCPGTGLHEAEKVRGKGSLLGFPWGSPLSPGDEVIPLGFEGSGDRPWVK